jgi:hypothetical protein
VPLDLADDGRDGVPGEVGAEAGVELVDRLDEPDRRGLQQVVDRLAAPGVPVGEVAAGIAAIARSSSSALPAVRVLVSGLPAVARSAVFVSTRSPCDSCRTANDNTAGKSS